jgi:hypothetical protein
VHRLKQAGYGRADLPAAGYRKELRLKLLLKLTEKHNFPA